jgi:MFS family permease
MRDGFGGRFTAAVCVGTMLNPINSSIIAIALVSIGEAFGVGTGTTSWLVSVLYIATAIGQPTMGRLADLFGPRRIYLCGLVMLTIGGLLGFWGASIGMLLLARVVIGLGTSAAYPAMVAMIRQQSERIHQPAPGIVLGALAAAAQVSLALGPPLGGLLIAYGGWHWVFLVNLPLAAIGAATALAWLPRDRPAARDVRTTGTDLARLLRNRALMLTYLRYGLTMVITYSFLFGWTQWLEQSVGVDVALAGGLLVPMFLVAIPISLIGARRGHVRVPLVVGGAGLVVAAASLLLLDEESPMWALFGVSVLFGLQNGLNAVGNQAAMYAEAPAEAAGTAAGFLRTSQYIGAILAAFLLSTSYGEAASDEGLHRLAVSLVIIAGMVLLLVIGVHGQRRTIVSEAEPGFGTVHP